MRRRRLKWRQPAMSRLASYGMIVVALAAAAAFASVRPAASVPAAEPVVPQPELAPGGRQVRLLGVSGAGAERAAWGYRLLPLGTPQPAVDGQQLKFGAVNPSEPAPQLVFFRHTASTGWQAFETPRDETGQQAYRGFDPFPAASKMTPSGGGALAGFDTVDRRVKILARDPGSQFRLLPAIPDTVLETSAATTVDQLGDGPNGKLALTAVETNDRTAVFASLRGAGNDSGIAHFDGSKWTRERIDLVDTTDSGFRVVAIDAVAGGGEWLVGRADTATGAGLILCERVIAGGAPRWVKRSLGPTMFSAAESPSGGVSDLAVLNSGNADPLAVTDKGAWIDGSMTVAGGAVDFTVYFDRQAGRITRTWCDAQGAGARPLCDHSLGFKFARSFGYRSIAWSGPGFGSRIVSNALKPGGGEESARGSYMSLNDGAFVRMPGAGTLGGRAGAAFFAADDGWFEGPVRVSRTRAESRFVSWPLTFRDPLLDVTSQPGGEPGAIGSSALAVGVNGAVARYVEGQGWNTEYLLTSSGAVNKATLRGVAWPEPSRAHAVGDLGAMWMWRANTGLWERDPGAPVGFQGNFMDVAFQPGRPERGYAVGREGLILRYDKTWTKQSVPSTVADDDITQVAFAGSLAIAAAGEHLLVNDGTGWVSDLDVDRLMTPHRDGSRRFFAVSGLPDGSAIAAGDDGLVIKRELVDGSWKWHFVDQPLSGNTVIAASLFREEGKLRAVVSVVPEVTYPEKEIPPEHNENDPPILLPAIPLPGDGFVLRETATGWSDEQHMSFGDTGNDKGAKFDPVTGFALDSRGQGWAIGGWSGRPDSARQGADNQSQRTRVQTARIYRYSTGAQTPPAGAGASAVPLEPGGVSFAVGGHAQCDQSCADLSAVGIGPDRKLTSALAKSAELAGRPDGPRFFLYTGGRAPATGGAPQSAAEEDRYSQLLSSQPQLATFAAPSESDSAGGSVAAFKSSFANFSAPFGAGTPGPHMRPVPIGAQPGPGARTHFAFDYTGPGGPLRVVVIDNSRGSLAASESHQNPVEPQGQAQWLQSVLVDAKRHAIAAIVMGSRDLNERFKPSLNVAEDGDEVAALIRDNGASAYFFERSEENRATFVPSGSTDAIPSFGTGTLGYRGESTGSTLTKTPDSIFGDSGFLIARVDPNGRDPITNRAPVKTRLIPVIEELSVEAVDGVLLRRSRPALFRGLGRRPFSGDRWGAVASGQANPGGSDPFTRFPPDDCKTAGCTTRVTPEYVFASSDPDIGDFVMRDPNSANLRKPLLDAHGKAISDPKSGLFCAFNAGTTTVSVVAGGLSYARNVTVQPGLVNPPCGTRPLNPKRFTKTAKTAPAAVPPPVAAAAAPVTLPPPPPPPPPLPTKPFTARPAAPLPVLPPQAQPLTPFRATIPPPAPTLARPIPPGGALARVQQEEKEEEAATEESQAFSRYNADDHAPSPVVLTGFLIMAAFAGASLKIGRSRRAPAYVRSGQLPNPNNSNGFPGRKR